MHMLLKVLRSAGAFALVAGTVVGPLSAAAPSPQADRVGYSNEGEAQAQAFYRQHPGASFSAVSVVTPAMASAAVAAAFDDKMLTTNANARSYARAYGDGNQGEAQAQAVYRRNPGAFSSAPFGITAAMSTGARMSGLDKSIL